MPRHQQSNFLIIQLNINSLVSHTKRAELDAFLKRNKPDAMLLCETVLRHNHNVNFHSYTIERKDKQSGETGRGTAILINKNVQYSIINTDAWKLNTLEATAILIPATPHPLLLVSAYRFNANTKLDQTDFDKIMLHRAGLGPGPTIIGGDFNARHTHWFNHINCRSGLQLHHWLSKTNCPLTLQRPLEPTFYRNSYTSYLDLFLVSNDVATIYKTNHGEHLEIRDFPSDHRAVLLEVNLQGTLPPNPPKKAFNYANTNWRHFRNALDRHVDESIIPNHRTCNTNEIDAAIEHITNSIHATMHETIPTYTTRQHKSAPIPESLQKFINEKHKLRKKWQIQRYNHDAHLLKSQIRNLTTIIKNQLMLCRRNYWEKSLQKIKLNNHTFKKLKSLAGFHNRSTIPPLRDDDPQAPPATSDSCKAALLAQHFEKVHNQNKNLGDPHFIAQTNATVRAEHHDIFEPQHVFTAINPALPLGRFVNNTHLTTHANLKNIIQSRANKASTGDDNIPNIILKNLSLKASSLITIIFNQTYNISYFPDKWKNATVVPIPKKSKPPTSPSSYRPIALLPCISKIFEVAINRKITDLTDEMNTLPDDQYGFRHERGAPQAIVKLQTHITTNLCKKTPTIACLLDIEKAFDTVWTEGLVHKLEHTHRLPTPICRLIYNYLSKRTFKVRINETTSPSHNIAAGVPQGGVLSATLYNLYVADMPLPPAPATPPIHRLQYADDVILYTSTKLISSGQTALNNHIKNIADFYFKWRLKLNPDKVEVTVFKGNKRCHTKRINSAINNLTLTTNNHTVTAQKQIKYLGVTMTQKPSSIAHLKSTRAKATNALRAISGLLKTTNGLGTKIKILCYKQLIRPIITYAFPSWCIMSAHQMERVRILERRCLRICLRSSTNLRPKLNRKYTSNKRLYDEAKLYKIERIDIYMLHQALKFFDQATRHPNLKEIADFTAEYLDSHLNTHPPPWMIQHLHNTRRLFNDAGAPVYYHRRFKNNNPSSIYAMDT